MEKETRVSKYAEYRKSKGIIKVEENIQIEPQIITKEEKSEENSKSTITVSYDDVVKGIDVGKTKKGLTLRSKEIIKYIVIGCIIALLIGGIVLLAILLGR